MRVMLDSHLAELYQVETKALNQAVKRNLRRFPEDFMFQLDAKEWQGLKNLRSQTVTSSSTPNDLTNSGMANMWSQIVTTSRRRKGHTPFAFTEQGVAMLSSVLTSDRAIDVNINIMRTFVTLRQHLTNYEELTRKISTLEKQMNRKFKDVYEALDYLMASNQTTEIGFRQATKKS